MFFSAADLADLYAATGDTVILAGETQPRRAHFAEAGQEVFGGDIIATEPTLRYPTSWPALPRHQQLTVAGRTWRTRAVPRALGDGLEAVVALELVP
jgi:hypothetical protein